MIAFIGNRPVLQVGRHQVTNYDTSWLIDALEQAAVAADCAPFPFVNEVRDGIVAYLEQKCALRLLPIKDLFARVREMLDRIGCPAIAEKLTPVAPPMSLSLARIAREAGHGFELAFFEALRVEIIELRNAGVRDLTFLDLDECVLLVAARTKWDRHCERLRDEIRGFLASCTCDHSIAETAAAA